MIIYCTWWWCVSLVHFSRIKHGCRLGHIPQQGINDKVHLELLISMLLSLSMWKHTQKHTYTHTHTYTYTHSLSIYIFIHMKLWSLSRVYKVDTESQTIRASNVHTWFRSNLDFACVTTCWNKMVKLTPIGRKSKYNYFNLQLLF